MHMHAQSPVRSLYTLIFVRAFSILLILPQFLFSINQSHFDSCCPLFLMELGSATESFTKTAIVGDIYTKEMLCVLICHVGYWNLLWSLVTSTAEPSYT